MDEEMCVEAGTAPEEGRGRTAKQEKAERLSEAVDELLTAAREYYKASMTYKESIGKPEVQVMMTEEAVSYGRLWLAIMAYEEAMK